MTRTSGVAPKATAATIAALVTPVVARLLGVDENLLLGLITAAVTFLFAYFAPAATLVEPQPDQQLDDPALPSEVEVPTLNEPPTTSALIHSKLNG